MAEDSVLIIMTSGPDTPRRCATPFFFASLAAAMEYEVNMFFTIDGTLLLKKGLAETVLPEGRRQAGERVHPGCAGCWRELHGLHRVHRTARPDARRPD